MRYTVLRHWSHHAREGRSARTEHALLPQIHGRVQPRRGRERGLIQLDERLDPREEARRQRRRRVR